MLKWIGGLVGAGQRAALAMLTLLMLLSGMQDAGAVTITGATLTATTPTQTAQTVIYVRPSETFTANVSGNTSGSNTNWRGTGWSIANSLTSYYCADTGNVDTNNSSTTVTVSFTATAPATAGTYNAYFFGDSNNTCGGTTSNVLTMTGAVVVDGTAPVATISCNSPASCGTANPTRATSVTWTVNFSENVTGLAASNFTLTTSGVSGASITGIAGSGSSYTVTASTGSGSGTIALNLNTTLTGIIDRAGNNPAAVSGAASNTYTIDKTLPTATIACYLPAACGPSSPTKLAQVQWTVTFSEAVTGVTAGNFALSGTGATGASITSVTSNGNVYTVSATTGSSGVLTLNLNTNLTTIADAAGNNPAAVSGVSANSYTIDKTAPTAVITCYTPTLCGTGSPTNATSVIWAVTFSETVTGVLASNFTLSGTGLSGASIASVSASGTTYYVTANTGASGTLALSLDANLTNIFDGAGNTATSVTAVASNTYTIDKVAPTAAITCSNPALCGTANPTSNTQVVWAVTFSESVSGLTSSNFGFSGTAASGAALAGVSGSGTSWTVTANATTDGTLGLNLSYNLGNVVDSASNSLAAAVTATAANTYKISHTPTATITCSSPASCGTSNPTSSTSVTWLITFSESVTGVSLTNFTLSGTGINHASLSSVTGSGTSWTVTAATGDNGTLGLNMNANLTGIVDSDSLSPAAVLATSGNTYTIDSSATGECFTDDFTRASLGSNWATTTSGGTFGLPVIVSNRLRLTNSTTGVTTAAHLQRVFPASGNKMVVEFDYYSYNGTTNNGADGMAVILSDATIAPVAGAFGGSLGYAQKAQNNGSNGSDCNTVGGCPGFAGGWLGVGLDEYGNYSTSSEGRSGGTTAAGDVVAVRGSGSNQSGYNYHTRSNTLSPGIDSPNSATFSPGHRYRITVDHTDGVHAYVSVDRDATVGHTGYTNIISPYDAKTQSGQAAVPDNWFLSFTGSTGANYNTHEIGALKVCTTRPIAVPTLHHVRIIHDGAGLTCTGETVTLRACADASCSSLYLGSVTADINTTSGTWSADPVTFTGGQTTVTLTKTTTGNATLSGTVTSPTATTTALQCYNIGTAGDCVLPFSAAACSFDATEVGKGPSGKIYTKLAGTSFDIEVLALNAGVINTASTASLTPVLVDQNSTRDANGCGSTVLAQASPTTYTLAAGDLGRKTFAFNYANAAADVRVKVTSNGGTTACSSDNFSIRPASLAITTNNATNIDATTRVPKTTGTPILVAGDTTLNLTATSYNSVSSPNTAVTLAYTGTPKINNNMLSGHTGSVTAGTISGAFSAAVAGVASASTFAYSEAGAFKFKTFGVYDNTFTSVDQFKASPECSDDGYAGTGVAPSLPNTKDSNGMYPCYFGNTAESDFMGRFTPDHFDTVIELNGGVPMTCPSGQVCPTTYNGVVYSRQPFQMKVVAKRKNASANPTDGIVTNYHYSTAVGAFNFAKAVTLSAWDGLGSTLQTNPPASPSGSALGTTAVSNQGFANGIATLAGQTYNFGTAFSSTTPNAFATWTAPTDVYIRAEESAGGDSIKSLRNPAASSVEAGIKVVSGRAYISHAYGSELLRMRVPVLAQYWNGSRWVTSYFDDVSAFSSADIQKTNCLKGLNCAAVTVANQASTTLRQGAGQFFLAAPGAGVTGSVDLRFQTATAPAWLPSTVGRAKFGTFRSPLIFIRELY